MTNVGGGTSWSNGYGICFITHGTKDLESQYRVKHYLYICVFKSSFHLLVTSYFPIVSTQLSSIERELYALLKSHKLFSNNEAGSSFSQKFDVWKTNLGFKTKFASLFLNLSLLRLCQHGPHKLRGIIGFWAGPKS